MAIAVWPLADRQRVVRAYRPSETADSEAPFRTLRVHRWASAGRRVSPRSKGRLAGQITVFSALNVEAARLARHGYTVAAAELAAAAEKLEAGPEFTVLQRALTDLPDSLARQVIDGVLPDEVSSEVVSALHVVTWLTEQLRATEPLLESLAEVSLGWVTAVYDTHVVLALFQGLDTLLPRWMAVAVHRDRVGEPLAVVLDRLHASSAVAEAVPAIEYERHDQFSPFGRGDQRALRIGRGDERLLAGEPLPLKVLVPVRIEE